MRYSWTGWPSDATFSNKPVEIFNDLETAWEGDGLRLLEHRWSDRQIQLLFSAAPSVSPQFMAGRAKGRLDHALRSAGHKMRLSRKLSVQSVGENVTAEVESYIDSQVERAHFADGRFESLLKDLTVINPAVDLAQPTASARGRYWYNLHVVLVTEERYRIVEQKQLALIRDWCLSIATKKRHAISRMAVMPDHVHIALRGNLAASPNEVVGDFQNNLAFALGQVRVWQDSFYVGTFGSYNMRAIRRLAD